MKTLAAIALLLVVVKILIVWLDGPADAVDRDEDVSGWGTR